MSDLTAKHCKPCEGGIPALTGEQSRAMLEQLDDAWRLDDDARSIRRTFTFDGYYPTIAFVNAIAWIAHTEDHHPDLEVGYSKVVVTYSTHAIGGLSENDFICAAKVDALIG